MISFVLRQDYEAPSLTGRREAPSFELRNPAKPEILQGEAEHQRKEESRHQAGTVFGQGRTSAYPGLGLPILHTLFPAFQWKNPHLFKFSAFFIRQNAAFARSYLFYQEFRLSGPFFRPSAH